MKKVLRIGRKEYKSKNDAIIHYRNMLNSYKFGQSLNDSDFDDIMDLLDYDFLNYLAERETSENNENELEEAKIEFTNNSLPSLFDVGEDQVAEFEKAWAKNSLERLAMRYNLPETTFTDITFSGSIADRDCFLKLLQNERPLEGYNSIDEMYDRAVLMKADNLYVFKNPYNIPDKEAYSIEDVKVARRIPYKTKCFEISFRNKTKQFISYLMIINNKKFTSEDFFNIACRNSISNDVIKLKQKYFEEKSVNGQVKCQETDLLSNWNELVADHRQPYTFSVIVDTFKKISKIDLEKIEYTSNDQNKIIFKDNNLTEEFRNYHNNLANIRIVRKECNLSRTGMARIKKTSKDLTIK